MQIQRQENKIQQLSYRDHQRLWQNLYRGKDNSLHSTNVNIQGKKSTRQLASLNAPNFICHELASLICNEQMELNFEDDEDWDFIGPILEYNSFITNFQEAIEMMFALGGVATEVFFNSETDKIEINYIQPINIIPIKWDSSKQITEARLKISEERDKEDIYTLYREHKFEKGTYVIENILYKKAVGEEGLGKRWALQDKYPELEDKLYFNNIDKPFFSYCKPNTTNNIDLDCPMGIAIYANAIDTLKALDTAFDSFLKEFRLGYKRILVPDTYLRYDHTNHQAYFDTDDEVFQGMAGMDTEKITDVSVALRVEEHIQGINFLLEILATQCGFSVGTFTFDGKSMKTATEVISEQSKTFKTKKSHEILIEKLIRDTIEAIFNLADSLNINNKPKEIDLSIHFDDSIADDTMGTIKQEALKVNSGLTSKKRAIMKVHGVGEDEAEQILFEISEENKTVTPEVADIFGAE